MYGHEGDHCTKSGQCWDHHPPKHLHIALARKGSEHTWWCWFQFAHFSANAPWRIASFLRELGAGFDGKVDAVVVRNPLPMSDMTWAHKQAMSNIKIARLRKCCRSYQYRSAPNSGYEHHQLRGETPAVAPQRVWLSLFPADVSPWEHLQDCSQPSKCQSATPHQVLRTKGSHWNCRCQGLEHHSDQVHCMWRSWMLGTPVRCILVRRIICKQHCAYSL